MLHRLWSKVYVTGRVSRNLCMLVFFPIIPMFYILSPRIQLLTLSDFIFLLFCYFLWKKWPMDHCFPRVVAVLSWLTWFKTTDLRQIKRTNAVFPGIRSTTAKPREQVIAAVYALPVLTENKLISLIVLSWLTPTLQLHLSFRGVGYSKENLKIHTGVPSPPSLPYHPLPFFPSPAFPPSPSSPPFLYAPFP